MPPLAPTVFVLGAGFTKAFLPDAPLMEDDYDGDHLAASFRGFRYATQFLELERSHTRNGYINIERLMTRLDGGMPYDFEFEAREEAALLLSHLKRAFMQRLDRAKAAPRRFTEALDALARYCVDNCVMCITFNYDDLLDEALWKVQRVVHAAQVDGSERYWHPDGGYGFFCKPAVTMIRDVNNYMDVAPMFLLKLHGSVNWRTKRGDPQPHAIDSVRHHETWLPRTWHPTLPSDMRDEYLTRSERNLIDLHLDPDPFIVPPVLLKSALVEQPILRLVWYRAYEALRSASRIFFLGYSLPTTDLAAGILFREAIPREAEIRVVNVKGARVDVLRSYRRHFPRLAKSQFDFRGVLDWSQDFLAREAEQGASQSA